MSSASERIGQVVSAAQAAEAAAAETIKDAEARARSYVEETRREAENAAREKVDLISELTQPVIEQADALKQKSAVLAKALGGGAAESGESAQRAEPGTSASERVRAIEEAADTARTAAAGIVENVRSDARHYVEESRREANRVATEHVREMSELAGPMVEQAESLRQKTEEMMATLGRAAPPPGASDSLPRSAGSDRGGPTLSEGAQILAIQMKTAGSSREEIENRLRQDFGLNDPSRVLDDLIGPD